MKTRATALVGLLAMLATGLVATPASAATLSVAEYERAIVQLINSARVAEGLAPLSTSVAIANGAREWSGTMASSGRFEHNPSYVSHFPAGWRWAAENVAYGALSTGQYESERIHQNLMDSRGHRSNILDERATHVGVGVAFVRRSGMSYVYVTQNFGSYPASSSTTSGPTGAPAGADTPFTQLVVTPDASGDRIGDLFAVDSAGSLWLHRGSGTGGVARSTRYGPGWSSMRIFAPGDWNGDRKADLIAADSRGYLWLYPGNGWGSLGRKVRIGHGWTSYRIIPAGDVTGDGAADLLAINSQGILYVYPGNGRGGFIAGGRKQVGWGWRGADLYAAGDINGDGRADILGLTSNGILYSYRGKGNGYFAPRDQIGWGWTTMLMGSGADLNRDGYADIVGRDSAGRLWFFAGKRGGWFAPKVQVARGW